MRMTGKVTYIEYNPYIYGRIETEKGELFILLGKNLYGYRGENLYQFGLVEGSIVSFDFNDSDGDSSAKNIKVEWCPSKITMVWRASVRPLVSICVLITGILTVLYFRDLSSCVVLGILVFWILSMCREMIRKNRKIFD